MPHTHSTLWFRYKSEPEDERQYYMSCKHWRQRCVSISLSHFTFTECCGIPQLWMRMRTNDEQTTMDICDLLFLFALCPSQCCVFIHSNIHACGCQCLYTPYTLSLPHTPQSNTLRLASLSGIWRAAVAYDSPPMLLHGKWMSISCYKRFFLVRSPLFRMFAVCARCMVFSHSLALRLFWSVGGYFAPSHEIKIKKQQNSYTNITATKAIRRFNGAWNILNLVVGLAFRLPPFISVIRTTWTIAKGLHASADTISIKYKLHRKRN